MAQRFGGKFSPDGQGPADQGSYRGAVRTRAGGRVNLLFLAPLPLIWRAFTGGPSDLLLNLIALGVLLLAAWLTREGIQAQEAYEARKVARRPGLPRKMLASLLTGIGLAVAGFAASGGLVEPMIYGILGTVLHSFAFGFDPLKDKGMDGVDQFQTDRVARAVDKAESYLTAMSDAIKRAGDRQVEARVERFQSSVRDMLRTVEDDPRDLTAAKKFLSVYLMGARDATSKFADVYARSRDAGARSDYMMLLTDLEENFVAKTRSLMDNSNTDLEVEISVLRDRLQREGVRLDNNA
ncbi:5-bromo-4-chloroindolyl phosphate hydrolysis family protein [Roseovarius sp. 2305UL8-3]|uniref:5-bromo-4-chloroindolyl phosphate hydrolysis family protein n=1 Tax=Roseovarius conchicola TaxID=3121636 RepID=UPI003527410C